MRKTTKESLPKVGIIGIGMVGAELARYFIEIKKYRRGKNLFLYDIDPKKSFFDDSSASDIVFICVPTPRGPDGSCNLSAVESVFRTIKSPKIMVIRSTVTPGTTEQLQREYPKHKVLFNPEFLTESQAWEDMVRPNAQIVGFTKKSLEAAHEVLSLLPKAPFMSPWGAGYKKHALSSTEAELVKVFTNAFFALKVTFANALADVSEKIGADYEHVREALGVDWRVAPSHLDVHHGGYRGFGGYCLPKDLDGVIVYLKKLGLDPSLFEITRELNKKLLERQGLSLSLVSTHNYKNQKRA